MKKVSLILTTISVTVALTIGLSAKIKAKPIRHETECDQVYQYTQNGVSVFTGTRLAAQSFFGCAGSTVICAKAWTTTKPPIRMPSQDIFDNE